MKYTKIGSVLLATALISGCGGNFKPTAPQFSHLVSFGDSLSDVGTYRVGEVAALGGGEFTINSPADKIWVEDIANALALPAPCAAETGLDGAAAYGFNVPVAVHAGCYGYAQGGSRVTNPYGPGNAALGGSNAIIGMLTVPIATQVSNYLSANGGTFTGKELVTVWGGANDVFIQLATVNAGGETPTQAAAALEQAATEEAALINTEILAKGANYVLVLNLPDISLTPMALAEPAAAQGFIQQLTVVYNTTLKAALAAAPATKLAYFDTFTASHNEATNATAYGLTNITTPACNLTPAVNPLGSSLICSTATITSSGAVYYEYADDVHPTPYAHALLSKGILTQLTAQGWY
jgi:phospholipase/lecithinase/hemolysin